MKMKLLREEITGVRHNKEGRLRRQDKTSLKLSSKTGGYKRAEVYF